MGEVEAGGIWGTEMTFDHFTTCRSLLIAAMIVIAATPAGLAFAQTVGAIADSEPITELEIQQRSRLTEQSTRKTPARDEVIDELRKEKLKVQEAREFGVEVSDSEVDQAYANMASSHAADARAADRATRAVRRQRRHPQAPYSGRYGVGEVQTAATSGSAAAVSAGSSTPVSAGFAAARSR